MGAAPGDRALIFADLLAAQAEMPSLQKTAINPHFGNRYIPLEELIAQVLPVLHRHGFVVVQMPRIEDGVPVLTTRLIHRSGECLDATMALMCQRDDPQGQGSAITYARRYALMAMLGLAADPDDDAEGAARPQMRGGRERPVPAGAPQIPPKDIRPPACEEHGPMQFVRAGKTKDGRDYPAFWSCRERRRGCPSKTVNADEWAEQQRQFAQARGEEPDYDAVPFE